MDPKSRILIVDDEPGIRIGCQRALEPAGYLVEQAASFKEGLIKVASGDYDLVLLDVMLPDGRGIDLLPEIIARDPQTVTIIVTGYATVEMAVNAIKHGAYDFISKPFTSDLLLLSVQQGLEKRRLSQEAQRLATVERQAQELERQKEEAERLGAFKAEFALTVAHELRAPVAGAQSLLRTLTNGLVGEFAPRQQAVLERLEARLDELLALINDLLTLAGSRRLAEEQAPAAVPLGPAIEKALAHFEAMAAERGITLRYEPAPAAMQVMASEDGLGIIFTNLVGNAIKYSQDGGTVRVHVERVGERVRGDVIDEGIGIPEGALSELGQEFYRAPNARQSGISGTGLGLSIVKQYLAHFGGELRITSREGQGTTASVLLRASDS